jgi:kynurenine formamidase
VLIDFVAWTELRGEQVDPNTRRAITLDEVKSILKHQNVEVQPGDILVFRTGWLAWYSSCEPSRRHDELCVRNAPGQHNFIGLESSRDFVAWVWDNRIAAVSGDQVAFEATPPPSTGFGWLHEHLLAALGCPIGELWDTEELTRYCKESQRYTFMLVSTPLHVNGGVASPANAVAVF